MESGKFRHMPNRDAVFITDKNTRPRKSPLAGFADWVISQSRGRRAPIHALMNSAGTVAELSEIIEFAAPKSVVSLDFFDTLVIRPVEPPEYVLGKVAELSVALIYQNTGIRLSEPAYMRGRASCEQALRWANAHENELDHETNLPSILDRFLQQIGVNNPSLVAELLALEAQLESDVLLPNPGALSLLARLKEMKKRVIVMSDMYLTAQQFAVVAQRLGMLDYIDRFYVSGDIGLAKHSGRMFGHVLEQEKILKQDYLHVGDNHHSDFKIPASLGVDAIWLYQKRHFRRRSEMESRLRKNPGRFIQKLIQSQAKTFYKPAEVLEQFLFTGFAPAVFSMAYRSLGDCISLGITKLYFLAREGITLKSVYELLIARHPEFSTREFQISVLYCSRASTVCARFSGLSDPGAIAATVLDRFGEVSYKNLLAAWNIREEDLDYCFSVRPELANTNDLKSLFASNPQFSAAFSEHLLRQRALLEAYLRQEGVFEQPCAFIDVGWGGTIQRNVEALGADANIFGLYLGTDPRFESRNVSGYLFSPADYRAGAVLKSAPLTETLLSMSGLGTTISYESIDGKVRPQFKEGTALSSSCERARDRVLTDFYDVFFALTRQFCIPTPVLVEVARDQYFKLVSRPRAAFVRAIQDLRFEFDWGDPTEHKLVLALSVRDFLHPTRLLRILWQAPWLFGTLKANHLGFLNAPVSWLLGHEERINFRKLRKYLPNVFVPS